jgi:hypothetical protein
MRSTGAYCCSDGRCQDPDPTPLSRARVAARTLHACVVAGACGRARVRVSCLNAGGMPRLAPCLVSGAQRQSAISQTMDGSRGFFAAVPGVSCASSRISYFRRGDSLIISVY